MRVIDAEIPGMLDIMVEVYRDGRGAFMESFNSNSIANLAINTPFVQDNISYSKKGVLRGLHYMAKQPQGMLVQVLQGKIFDVTVDLRKMSPMYGKHVTYHLTYDGRQLYLPPGTAHGFLALEDSIIAYKCTQHYDPHDDYVIRYNDESLKIPWPRANYIISDKDVNGADFVDHR